MVTRKRLNLSLTSWEFDSLSLMADSVGMTPTTYLHMLLRRDLVKAEAYELKEFRRIRSETPIPRVPAEHAFDVVQPKLSHKDRLKQLMAASGRGGRKNAR